MSTHANRVKMTVTSVASAGTGTITLNAASTGYRSFATAYGANATVDILITEGTTWEIARNCTYTHSGTTVSRGTLENSSTGSAVEFTSAAVVSVIATAAFGNNAALNHKAETVVGSNVTGVVGTLHLLDIDGMTAARDFVLPTVAATGDRVGVFCTTDAPTTAAYVLQIKSGAAGDLINGTDHSSTIWSALLIKGECLIFRCIDGSTVDWIVEYDGRIPQLGAMSKTGSDTTTSSTGWTATTLDTIDSQRGCTVSTSGVGTITWRRASFIIAAISWGAKSAATCSDNEQQGPGLSYGGAVGVGTTVYIYTPNHAGTATKPVGNTGISVVEIPVGSVLQLSQYASTTSNLGARALNSSTFMRIQEIMK